MSRVCHMTSRLGRKREILLHPKSIPRLTELGDRTMGCRTLASPLIRSVRHPDYPVHPSIPEFRSPTFHVSDLRFVSCFRSYSHFPFCSIFEPRTPNPDPVICPILFTLLCSLWYLYVRILMYVPQSEIDIDCPSNSPSEPPSPRLSLARNPRTVDVWWRST